MAGNHASDLHINKLRTSTAERYVTTISFVYIFFFFKCSHSCFVYFSPFTMVHCSCLYTSHCSPSFTYFFQSLLSSVYMCMLYPSHRAAPWLSKHSRLFNSCFIHSWLLINGCLSFFINSWCTYVVHSCKSFTLSVTLLQCANIRRLYCSFSCPTKMPRREILWNVDFQYCF